MERYDPELAMEQHLKMTAATTSNNTGNTPLAAAATGSGAGAGAGAAGAGASAGAGAGAAPAADAIILTEGEFDAMSVYQETGLPAVSLPNGCRSLPVELLPWLERFSRIQLN